MKSAGPRCETWPKGADSKASAVASCYYHHALLPLTEAALVFLLSPTKRRYASEDGRPGAEEEKDLLINPCGLLAWSLFNDTFELYNHGTSERITVSPLQLSMHLAPVLPCSCRFLPHQQPCTWLQLSLQLLLGAMGDHLPRLKREPYIHTHSSTRRAWLGSTTNTSTPTPHP
jgi:hypothetical protein